MDEQKKVYWLWLFILILMPAQAFLQGQNTAKLGEKPKNIVLMIGDGMGITQISLMYYRANLVGPFYLDSFPVVGLQKTHSFSNVTTDSGAAATAMGTGVKTYNSAVGVGPDTIARRNLFEMAKAKNLRTGLVVTSSIADATPAGFVAHRTYRGFKEQIALDFLHGTVDFIIGGGSDFMDNRFLDNRNLIYEMKEIGYDINYMGSKNFIRKISPDYDKYIFLMAEKDPPPAFEGRDYFPNGLETACVYLSESPEGFFIMAEGAQIDFACHRNAEAHLIMELLDFNLAVGRAFNFAKANKETLVIVTADHECGDLIIDPTKTGHKPKFSFQSNKHTPQMVPVFAFGPGSENFNGIFDNTQLFEKIKALLLLE